MRSLFVPLKLATDARKLEFITHLDPAIDRVCTSAWSHHRLVSPLDLITFFFDLYVFIRILKVSRKALYEALGESEEVIEKRLTENPDEAGIVVGDETRLRQIITNLARSSFLLLYIIIPSHHLFFLIFTISNACKFTPTGGKLTIATKLSLPSVSARVEGVEGNGCGFSSSSSSASASASEKENENEGQVQRFSAISSRTGQNHEGTYRLPLFLFHSQLSILNSHSV